MNLAHLGPPVGPMTRVPGKSSNRMWRLATDRGVFAVKELNPDRRSPYRFEDVFRLERAAFAAGIPMPEPISAGHDVLVHRWVDGEQLPDAPVRVPFASAVGAILARLHSLDLAWAHPRDHAPMPTDWPVLAARAVASQQPWADDLVAVVDVFLAISDVVDRGVRRGPVVVSHNDVAPWNLLDVGGRPVLLDWELAGPIELAGELGSAAFNLASWGGDGSGAVRPAVFHALLDGYAAGGGTLPAPGPDWFVHVIAGWARFTRWNALRCLDGIEPSSGPDLATAHEELRNGLRGLPALFARLPELEELIGGR